MPMLSYVVSGLGHPVRRAAALLLLGLIPSLIQAQIRIKPGDPQSQSFVLLGAVAHLGNGQVIANSAIGVREGRLALVADATNIRLDPGAWDTIITVYGQHAYPGFIAAGSGIGLREVAAVRATVDDTEVGKFNPHVRSSIAYNTDSRVIPTLRNNGILMAQVVPQGGIISGTSSILHLDGWNWEDALVLEDDALHLSWARIMSYPGWWVENARMKRSESYQQDVDELYAYFNQARAYAALDKPSPRNLGFEAMRGVFDSSKKVYIRCYEAKEIVEAVRFGEHFGLDYVLVNAHAAWLVTDVLRQYDVPVLLEDVHRLPAQGHHPVDQPFRTPALLAEAGVRFGISLGADWDAFWNFRNLPYHAGTAAAYGLEPERAIQAITGDVASILGLDGRAGTLQSGLEATFFLASGDMLDVRQSQVLQAWIQGREVNLDDSQRQLYRLYRDKYGLED